jgi:hypothetical protein
MNYIGRYGFDYPQDGDPAGFLAALTEHCQGLAVEAEERAYEEEREQAFEEAKEVADDSAKEVAHEAAKEAAEEAAKEAADEAYKEAYEEAYKEAYDEAYREALIEALAESSPKNHTGRTSGSNRRRHSFGQKYSAPRQFIRASRSSQRCFPTTRIKPPHQIR